MDGTATAHSKQKWRFLQASAQLFLASPFPKADSALLQKYWHKGAFFQSGADTFTDEEPVLGTLMHRAYECVCSHYPEKFALVHECWNRCRLAVHPPERTELKNPCCQRSCR